jgi:protocatechuate 3,4-dioxygenase beta subunit
MQSVARIVPQQEPGEPMVLEGVVRRADGTPAPGIVVYAYHTNTEGVYPSGETAHGALRGWARTDQAGRFAFHTIRPGPYPSRNVAAHVHMHVIEPGVATYYIANVLFTDDPLLTKADRESQLTARGGPGLCEPVREADGTWRVRRDIVLGQAVPGYPGD